MEPVDIYRHCGIFKNFVKFLFFHLRKEHLIFKIFKRVDRKIPLFSKYNGKLNRINLCLGIQHYDSFSGKKEFIIETKIKIYEQYISDSSLICTIDRNGNYLDNQKGRSNANEFS